MKNLIVGYGVQGKKRAKLFKKGSFNVFDPFSKFSDFSSIDKIPFKNFSKVYLCVPDKIKIDLISFFLKKKLDVMVEKPLHCNNIKKLKKVLNLAKNSENILYTAYNHRFEPNLIKLKQILLNKEIGKIYYCKIFYGNGTAKLVKKSNWKDSHEGVLFDLGSHLIDMCLFLFDDYSAKFKIVKKNKFENNSSDHAIIHSDNTGVYYNLEMTSCSWKNSFNLDMLGSKGSLHVENLCKWGDSKLTIRKRKYPAGTPKEKILIKKKGDPTWKDENSFFNNLNSKTKNLSFKKDLYISRQLSLLKK